MPPVPTPSLKSPAGPPEWVRRSIVQAMAALDVDPATLKDTDGDPLLLDELAKAVASDLAEQDLIHDPARILKLPASLSADDVTILQFEPAVQHAGAGSLVVQVPPVIGGDGLQDHELTAMSALVALISQLPPDQQYRVALWAAGRWAHDGVVIG